MTDQRQNIKGASATTAIQKTNKPERDALSA